MQAARQLEFPSHGGRRAGAGRPRGHGVSHDARPHFDRASAAHVTLRVAEHVWNLRSGRCFRVIHAALAAAKDRFGLRVIHFAVLGNHFHLIVEADSSESLSRGMQGLSIRIAKSLNRLMRARGRVLADHYHARLLRSPTELANAIAYVLENAAHHYVTATDSFTSLGAPEVTCEPRTWLLRVGWRRPRTARRGSDVS